MTGTAHTRKPVHPIGDLEHGHRGDGTTWAPDGHAGEGRPPYKAGLIVGGIAGLIVAAVALGGSGSPSTSGSAAPVDPATTLAAVDHPAATEASPGYGDGMYQVGVDIQPGLYRSWGNGYFERLSGASGEFDDVLANGTGSGGPAYVEILPSDAYFSTEGFDDWVLVSDRAAGDAPASSFAGDGMYRVGVDIEPGTYQATGTGYWERLSGATGEFEDIIANGNAAGQGTVTIAPGDSYFSTAGMGDWVRVD